MDVTDRVGNRLGSGAKGRKDGRRRIRKASDLVITNQLVVVALDGQKTGSAGAKRVTSDDELESWIIDKCLMNNPSNNIP